MVFTDAENVQPCLVRLDDLFEEVAQVIRRSTLVRGHRCYCHKTVQADFHVVFLGKA